MQAPAYHACCLHTESCCCQCWLGALPLQESNSSVVATVFLMRCRCWRWLSSC
jgi:hypothetical protein